MRSKVIESVVHDWVSELPFMQQALLMTAMRGPDGMPKECPAKNMVRYMRGAVMKPAGEINGNEDSFMWVNYELFWEYACEFFNNTDMYPMHFLMHLIHAAEVVGYNHPKGNVRQSWSLFYGKACKALHMNPETKSEMDRRMNQ